MKSIWAKGHVMCGVATNVITAVEIHGQYAHDSLFLPGLVKTTSQNFQMDEVSADKAYLGEYNLQAITAVGATPFIALKSNTIGRDGSLLRKMYYRFMAAPTEFFTCYHKRSNIEATFSSIKRKFGNALKSKSETAMVNETLLKFLRCGSETASIDDLTVLVEGVVMAPDIPKINTNRQLALGPSAWNFCDKVLCRLLHGIQSPPSGRPAHPIYR